MREVWVVEGRLLGDPWVAGVSLAKGDGLSRQRELNGQFLNGGAKYSLVRYVPAPTKKANAFERQVEALVAERDALKAKLTEEEEQSRYEEKAFIHLNAILESVIKAIRGGHLSEFDESHGFVREAIDIRAENAALKAERDALRASVTKRDEIDADNLADYNALLAENAALKARVEELEDLLVLMRGAESAWDSETWQKAIAATDAILAVRTLARLKGA